ncbi:hypothetical protein BYT27DRAFT_7083875 [Phlegmacium glaucopus]|nr:hypothetical protein BYT27DRAFT_7083875 [Phlegmacium glaucopus]
MTYNATVFPIPKPVSEDHITQYIGIRLAALKANPEAFGSTHAGESAFSPEHWRKRVNHPSRTTFFAITAPSTIADASDGSHHDEHEPKWIGTLSLLGPEMLRGVPFPPKIVEAQEKEDAEIYMLTGMWVYPDFRKKGVARQLVEHALQAVIDNDQDDQNREGSDRKQKILLLEVNDANLQAQNFYGGQGFVEEPGGTEEGTKWLARRIR